MCLKDLSNAQKKELAKWEDLYSDEKMISICQEATERVEIVYAEIIRKAEENYKIQHAEWEREKQDLETKRSIALKTKNDLMSQHTKKVNQNRARIIAIKNQIQQLENNIYDLRNEETRQAERKIKKAEKELGPLRAELSSLQVAPVRNIDVPSMDLLREEPIFTLPSFVNYEGKDIYLDYVIFDVLSEYGIITIEEENGHVQIRY